MDYANTKFGEGLWQIINYVSRTFRINGSFPNFVFSKISKVNKVYITLFFAKNSPLTKAINLYSYKNAY